MTEFVLNAELRNDLGKGASRRLRRNANLVPAVIYGGDKAPVSVSLKANEVAKLIQDEAAFSHVITLNLGDSTETVLFKALQRHPAKEFVMHADFIRVVADHKLTAHVPLHFVNQETSVGIKQQGGEASHTIAEVEVSCLPANLPEFLEVDMAAVEVGQTLHLSDLKLPEGVELVALAHGNDLAVANIHASRVKAEDEGEAAAE